MIRISPSILSCDLLQLEKQVRMVAEKGADLIHVDIMDGHYVPNLTFGHNMVEALKRATDVPLDCHLMVTNPDDYLEHYAKAGASILTVHAEVCTHLHRTIQEIRRLGMRPGVSLNPHTPVSTIEEVLGDLDLVLVMTVNPGFGGQKFIPNGLKKISQLRELAVSNGYNYMIEVDGGVNVETAKEVVAAGADTLVAGSAIFNAPDPVAAMNQIREAALAVA